MDPQGPSQPSQQAAYSQPANPITQTTSEQPQSQSHEPSSSSAPPIDHRTPHDVPSTHPNSAMPSSLGRGSTGPLEESISASDAQNSSDPNLEGEQMRPSGEGDVAEAVAGKKFGGHGEEDALTQNMDEKAKEHADALHERGQRTGREIEEEGKKGAVDVGEALGGRGKAVVLAADE